MIQFTRGELEFFFLLTNYKIINSLFHQWLHILHSAIWANTLVSSRKVILSIIMPRLHSEKIESWWQYIQFSFFSSLPSICSSPRARVWLLTHLGIWRQNSTWLLLAVILVPEWLPYYCPAPQMITSTRASPAGEQWPNYVFDWYFTCINEKCWSKAQILHLWLCLNIKS